MTHEQSKPSAQDPVELDGAQTRELGDSQTPRPRQTKRFGWLGIRTPAPRPVSEPDTDAGQSTTARRRKKLELGQLGAFTMPQHARAEFLATELPREPPERLFDLDSVQTGDAEASAAHGAAPSRRGWLSVALLVGVLLTGVALAFGRGARDRAAVAPHPQSAASADPTPHSTDPPAATPADATRVPAPVATVPAGSGAAEGKAAPDDPRPARIPARRTPAPDPRAQPAALAPRPVTSTADPRDVYLGPFGAPLVEPKR